MATTKCRLTKKLILDAIGTIGQQDFLVDTECSGLRVLLSYRGSVLSKSFQYYAKHNGKPVKQVIKAVQIDNGLKPVDIEKARSIARTWRTRLKSGESMAEILGSEQSLSLGMMLEIYLRQYKERSPDGDWKKVQSQIYRHFRDAHPKLWHKDANSITTDELISAFNRIKDKTNTLRQLRSYLNAAYSLAIRKTAQKPRELINCGIKQNPALDWVVEHKPKSREIAFTEKQIKALWNASGNLDDVVRGRVFRLWMMFGGTRMAQLERMTWADVNTKAMTVSLKDKKTGRLEDHYDHKLPLTKDMLRLMRSISAKEYIFTADNGGKLPEKYLYDTWVLLKTKLSFDERLSLDSLRKTATAYFINRRIPKDDRNLFFSHEKSGVEWANYQKSQDYLDIKRNVLSVWQELLK